MYIAVALLHPTIHADNVLGGMQWRLWGEGQKGGGSAELGLIPDRYRLG